MVTRVSQAGDLLVAVARRSRLKEQLYTASSHREHFACRGCGNLGLLIQKYCFFKTFLVNIRRSI